MFAGIGGFRSALDALGGECVFASEIDEFATRAYKALYNGAAELHGDITKIDAGDIPDHDLLVGGFPCQAFSVAGQRKGFEDTRGTLFFEIARIASVKKPRFMLLENVKGLLSHDKGNTFETMCLALNEIGYAIDFAVLNSKYYGVPQNRERIFIVASRDAKHSEWNVKGTDVVAKAKRRAQTLGIRTFNFDWPTNSTVATRLRDVLEANVDERYYLSEDKTAKLIAQLSERGINQNDDGDGCLMIGRVDIKGHDQKTRVYSPDGLCPTPSGLGMGGNTEPKIVEEIQIVGRLDGINGHDICRRVYSADAIAPTIPTGTSGNTTPKIAVLGHLPSDGGQTGAVYDPNGIAPTQLKQHGNAVTKIAELQQYSDGYGLAYTVDANYGKGTSPGDVGKGRRTHVIEEVRPVLTPDRVEKCQNGRRFKEDGEEAFTLTAQDRHGVAIGAFKRYRIRKLTPLECWRLQGFTDAQHETVKAAKISDSQRYKQAGNAVSVPVISAIGKRLIPLLNATQIEYQEAA